MDAQPSASNMQPKVGIRNTALNKIRENKTLIFLKHEAMKHLEFGYWASEREGHRHIR